MTMDKLNKLWNEAWNHGALIGGWFPEAMKWDAKRETRTYILFETDKGINQVLSIGLTDGCNGQRPFIDWIAATEGYSSDPDTRLLTGKRVSDIVPFILSLL